MIESCGSAGNIYGIGSYVASARIAVGIPLCKYTPTIGNDRNGVMLSRLQVSTAVVQLLQEAFNSVLVFAQVAGADLKGHLGQHAALSLTEFIIKGKAGLHADPFHMGAGLQSVEESIDTELPMRSSVAVAAFFQYLHLPLASIVPHGHVVDIGLPTVIVIHTLVVVSQPAGSSVISRELGFIQAVQIGRHSSLCGEFFGGGKIRHGAGVIHDECNI